MRDNAKCLTGLTITIGAGASADRVALGRLRRPFNVARNQPLAAGQVQQQGRNLLVMAFSLEQN